MIPERVRWLLLMMGFCCAGMYGCQSGSSGKKFGDALMTADIRYLEYNGELSGTWSFFERNQVDSLVPDALRHEFVINGQKVQSEKVKHNYHMYMVTDTFISRNLNVQIGPDNLVVSLNIPEIPDLKPDTLDTSTDWIIRWDGTAYGSGDSLTLVVTDPEQHTVLEKAAAAEGELTVPATRLFALTQGTGFLYLISSTHQKKDMDGIDLKYRMEVYSEDIPVVISVPEE